MKKKRKPWPKASWLRAAKASAVACNVIEDADLVRLIDTAVNRYGTVNVLVNNVGIGGGGRENPLR